MYSDEYLDYWGEVYMACSLSEPGIVFHEFLEDPWRCLCELGLQSAPVSLALGYQPLLPRQGQVARALWRRWEEEDDQASQAGTDVGTPVSGVPQLVRPDDESHPRQQSGRPVRELVHSALRPAVIPCSRRPRQS